ncbi:hypothetical protein GN244_ATG14655 [Phytophthora infestans]|uniref:Uncharacterized protein n=1 Tax=Phytophthora infestans TaxID=4787 RepID=A0A833WPW5_PHYIN|nr:hypothetical protein GN244_ATG14655 [Phytophthora infestans]
MKSRVNAVNHEHDSFAQMLTEESITDGDQAQLPVEQAVSAVDNISVAKGKRKRRTTITPKLSALQRRQRNRSLSVFLEDATSEAAQCEATVNSSAITASAPEATSVFPDVTSMARKDGLDEALAGNASSHNLLKRPRTQTSRKQNELLSRLYADKSVALWPGKEVWPKNSVYTDAGSSYIIERKNDGYVGISIVQRGIQNYSNIMKSPMRPAWRNLSQAERDEIDVNEDASDKKKMWRCGEY